MSDNKSGSPAARIYNLAGAIFGGIIGGLLLPRAWRYTRRLLRQPMMPAFTPPLTESHRAMEAQAYAIATDNLLAGLETRRLADGTARTILCAGARNFREPWARDTGFALFGLLELGETRAAREALEIFLLTQLPSGQFPVKIHSTSIPDRFIHSLFKREQPINQPIRPKYITAHKTISLDGNSLLVIAILHYAAQTGDQDFLRGHWEQLRRALDWVGQHARDADGLLHQGAFTDWEDTISRQGKVLYTNVVYWKALHEMGLVAEQLGLESSDRAHFSGHAARLRASIYSHFWRGDLGFFVTSKFFDNLSSSGNLLAIAWGLASPEQAHAILDAMRYYGMALPVPTKVVHRGYPPEFIAIENRLGGIADYHTYFAWLWLGAWHVIALARMARLEEASELLYNMSRVIVRDGAVHEVYAPNGHFASNLWYTSEAPLTWSAGMFVYACHVYHRRLGLAGAGG